MRKVHVRGAAVLTVVPADCSEEEVLDDAIITASCRSTKVDIEDASLDNVVKSRHKVMGAAVSLFLKADDDADLAAAIRDGDETIVRNAHASILLRLVLAGERASPARGCAARRVAA